MRQTPSADREASGRQVPLDDVATDTLEHGALHTAACGTLTVGVDRSLTGCGRDLLPSLPLRCADRDSQCVATFGAGTITRVRVAYLRESHVSEYSGTLFPAPR